MKKYQKLTEHQRHKRLYWWSRDRAKHRGIDFLFGFEEWVNWWEINLGPEWEKRRGPAKHQYCMARKGDKGPYHPNNVDCLTSSQNSRDKVKNGTSSKGIQMGCAKLSEKDVKEIFFSKENGSFLSLKYNINKGSIYRIKNKQIWKHITIPLLRAE